MNSLKNSICEMLVVKPGKEVGVGAGLWVGAYGAELSEPRDQKLKDVKHLTIALSQQTRGIVIGIK